DPRLPVRFQALRRRPRARRVRQAPYRRIRVRRRGALARPPDGMPGGRGAGALGAQGGLAGVAVPALGADPGRHRPDEAAGVSSPQRTLVVLPTYNERESLERVLAGVRGLGYDVLVVDDASPDGTG